jgi:hypothetical protein
MDGEVVVGIPLHGQTVWMIEKQIDGVAHWWMREHGQYTEWDAPERWTTDPNKARKYTTKGAAEYVMGTDMIGCIATSHNWI